MSLYLFYILVLPHLLAGHRIFLLLLCKINFVDIILIKITNNNETLLHQTYKTTCFYTIFYRKIIQMLTKIAHVSNDYSNEFVGIYVQSVHDRLIIVL